MKRAIIVLALCLCALPAMHARSLTEEELLASTALLLESSSGLTSEENMMLGMYGDASPLGSYGGLFVDETGNELFPESAPATSSTPAPAAAPAAAAAPPKAAASSALPADKSMAIMVAGVMVAVSAFLL